MYYSDNPIDSNCDDLLGRHGFAKLLAHSLINLNSQDTFSVGLFGKWGSGKTSIVNMMLREIEAQQEKLPKNEKLIVVHFEPWNFSNTDQLLSQFFVRLSNEFRSTGDKRLEKIGDALANYSDAFDFFSVFPYIGGLIGFFGKKGATAVGNKLKKGSDEKDILKQKEFVIELLKKQSSRILVVIDDIDRLSNEQIRQVFQLVASVAKFPNTIYLLVFDKDIVVKALENVQKGSGEDYLEKIIQMPIQIPDVKPAKLRQVLLARLKVILSEHEGTGFNQVHWQKLYEPCIAPLIDSLRTANRLCNVVQLKMTCICTEIDFADIVAISALEIYSPEVYEWIKTNKSILTGEHDLSSIIEPNKTQQDWHTFFRNQIHDLLRNNNPKIDNDQVEKIITFLSHLFPYFGKRIGAIYEAYDVNAFRKNNQIAHPEKFERYFSLDMDEILIKKSDLLNAALVFDCDEFIKFLIEQEKQDTSYDFLQEIKAMIPDIPSHRAKTIIIALLTASPCLDTYSQKNYISLSTGDLAEHIVLELLDIIDPSERLQYVYDTISHGDSYVLQSVAHVINMIELGYGRLAANGVEQGYNKVITLEELMQVETIFLERAKQILSEYNLFDLSGWRRVCYLLECFEPDYMKSYLESALKDDVNIVRYVTGSIAAWTGGGIEYEIQDSYKKYLTQNRILQAIKTLKESNEFFSLSEEVQYKCMAFYLYATTEDRNDDGHITQAAVNRLLSLWKG